MSQPMQGGVEHGWAICKTREGRLVRGPETQGTERNVGIDINCPEGSKLTGLYHSHPRYFNPQPSQVDLETAVRLGLQHLCIGIPELNTVHCYRLLRRGRR